ncbi:MAG: PQQ-binding-like beta-propeller repeat protein [Actinomycetota bacterium]
MRPPSLGACLRISVLALLSMHAVASFMAAASAQEGWPMAGRDAAHSGTAAGPAPPYRVAWERQVGGGGPATGVAVTDEAVVAVTREGVLALDPADGEVLWERGRSPGSAGVPAISGDLVLHARSEGVSGQVAARDLASGDLVWQATLGSTPAGGPTVAGNTAIVGTGQGEVVALDLADGEVAWRYRTAGGVAGPPAVADGVVVASSYRGSSGESTVYGLDLAGGEEGPLWQLSPGAVGPPSAPAIGESLAYVGISDLNVRAVDLAEGSEVWTSRSRDGFGPRQVPVAGEALVLADRTHVYRLDPENGEELWTFRLADLLAVGEGRVNTLLASSPAISGRTVLLGSGDGMLSGIDLDSGHRVWRRDLGSGPVGPVAVAGERIYAVTLGEGGSVVALEHDPAGRLLDEVSPTVLFVDRALLNFAAAAAGVAAALLLLFRFALRPRSGEGA